MSIEPALDGEEENGVHANQLRDALSELIVVARSNEHDIWSIKNAQRGVRNILTKLSSTVYFSSAFSRAAFGQILSTLLEQQEIDGDTQFSDNQKAAMDCIREVLLDKPLVLAEFCMQLSALLTVKGRLEDGLEYGGQALVLRMTTLGLLNEKTAESHFNLGLIYRMLGDTDHSRKELYIARGIHRKLHGDESLPVAECDLNIGYTEQIDKNFDKAFQAYLRCYRARVLVLGRLHEDSRRAEELLKTARNVQGDQFISGIELRDRVRELRWALLDSASSQYNVALFLGKLQEGEDYVLTLSKLRSIVAAAVKYTIAKNVVTDSSKTPEEPQFCIGGRGLEGSRDASNGDSNLHAAPNASDNEAQVTEKIIQSLLVPPSFLPESKLKQSGTDVSSFESIIKANSSSAEGKTGKLRASLLKSRQSMTASTRMSLSIPQRSVALLPSASGAAPALEAKPQPTNALVSALAARPFSARVGDFVALPKPELPRDISSVPEDHLFSNPTSAKEEATQKLPLTSPQEPQDDASLPQTHSPNAVLVQGTAPDSNAQKPLDIVRRGEVGTSPQGSGPPATADDDDRPPDSPPPEEDDGDTDTARGGGGDATTAAAEDFRMPYAEYVKVFGKNVLEGADAHRDVHVEEKILPFVLGERKRVVARDASGARVVIQYLSDVDAASLREASPDLGEERTSQESQKKRVPRTELNPPEPPPLPLSWPPLPCVLTIENMQQYLTGGLEAAGAKVPGSSDTGGPGGHLAALKGAVAAAAGNLGSLKTVPLEAVAPTDISGTIWDEPLEMEIHCDVLFPDLEEDFARNPKKKPTKATSAAALLQKRESLKSRRSRMSIVPTGQKEMSFLDRQRVQNLSIMLAKFGRREMSTIARAVQLFDIEALGASAVSSLLQFLPTPEERELIAKLEKDAAQNPGTQGLSPAAVLKKMGKAEQYLVEMSHVPNVAQRLEAMAIVFSAGDTQLNIQSTSEAMLKAVNEVRGSSRLRFIFRVVLELANAINSHSKGPNAVGELVGFKISALAKLNQIKTASGDTLDQYVVTALFANVPEALSLRADMPSIDEARNVVFTRLNSDLHKMEEGLELMRKLLDDEENAEAKDRISNYLAELSKYCSKSKEKLDEALQDFRELCVFFGEDPNTSQPEVIFGSLSTFIRAVEAAETKERDRERRLQRHQQQEASQRQQNRRR